MNILDVKWLKNVEKIVSYPSLRSARTYREQEGVCVIGGIAVAASESEKWPTRHVCAVHGHFTLCG